MRSRRPLGAMFALALVLLAAGAAAFDSTLAEHGGTAVWRSHIYACGDWRTSGLDGVGAIQARDTARCVDDYATGSSERFCVARITAATAEASIFDHGTWHTKTRAGRTIAMPPGDGVDLCRTPGEPPPGDDDPPDDGGDSPGDGNPSEETPETANNDGEAADDAEARERFDPLLRSRAGNRSWRHAVDES